MRNERRMLSSERGYGRSMVERPHGARSLLYCSPAEVRADARLVGGTCNSLPEHNFLTPCVTDFDHDARLHLIIVM